MTLIMRAILAMAWLLLLLSLSVASEGNVKIEAVTGQVCHAESPHYDSYSQNLIFIDLFGSKFCIYNLPSKETHCTCCLELVAGPIVPIQNATNQYLAALGPYLTKMYWDGRNNSRPDFTTIGRFDSGAAPGTEISDGKADCKRRFFADTRGKLGRGGAAIITNQASLFHYSKRTCTLEKNLDKDKSFYNGLAWNTDYSRFFIAESNEKIVYSFYYDVNSGNISNRKVLIDFKATNSCLPDGMTIDCGDNLWIACFSFGYVLQVDTTNGSILQTLHMPATDVTSVAWGGEYLSTLFVTSSRYMLSEEERQKQPLAGSVFAVTGLKFRGVPANSADICTVGCRGDGSCPPCDGNPSAIPNAPVEEFDTASCPAKGAIYGGHYCQIS